MAWERERERLGWEKTKLWRPLVWFVLRLFFFFLFNDTQKPMDVISDSSWYKFNPHVSDFPFIPWLLPTSLSFAFFPFRHDSGMPPQSQKKKCHTTEFSYDLYVHMHTYTHVYTLVNALDQKYFSCSFPLLCQSRRVTPGERDENRDTLEREERKREKLEKRT